MRTMTILHHSTESWFEYIVANGKLIYSTYEQDQTVGLNTVSIVYFAQSMRMILLIVSNLFGTIRESFLICKASLSRMEKSFIDLYVPFPLSQSLTTLYISMVNNVNLSYY